jgi:hypothetical protein
LKFLWHLDVWRLGFSAVIERFIHHVRTETPPATETAAEARERLREKFPRAAVRRMTHLGLLLGSTLDGVALTPEDALVYASSFAETRALEEFLGSFPLPSPLLFQTSIHPGGVQQVLIGRQQPIARLWPLAGRGRLVEHALLTALLEPAARIALVGGEERGTWLLEHGQASERSFAFAAVLTREAAGAVGSVAFEFESGTGILPVGLSNHGQDARATPDDPCPTLETFADALAARRPLNWAGGGGRWDLAWR